MRDLNPITQLGGRQVPIPPRSLADVEACPTVPASEEAQADEKDEAGNYGKNDGGLGILLVHLGAFTHPDGKKHRRRGIGFGGLHQRMVRIRGGSDR